jgi:acyl-CoA reductase-like NAD-dependent aldehyde dehydrogenase
MAGCADQVKRVTLELGGKSANVIFADSDIDRAAAAAPGAVFDNSGQDCCARSRILVQKSAFDRFMEGFEKSVKAYRVEDPNLDTSQMGPLISKKQLETVQSFLNDKDDAVAFTGSAPSGPGYWMPPTVLMPKSVNARTWQEEIFGPVVSVLTFEDEAEAISLANASDYGLSGSIWTNDLGRAMRVSRAIESGNLSVNSHSSVRFWTPFGGFKQSGLGRALGPDALDAYTETKNVFFATE